MRVGKRGYLETPSLMTDALFSWAQGMHRWYTVVIARRIVFFNMTTGWYRVFATPTGELRSGRKGIIPCSRFFTVIKMFSTIRCCGGKDSTIRCSTVTGE